MSTALKSAPVSIFTERDHKKTGQPQTAQQPVPRDGEVLAGEDRSRAHRHRVHQVRRATVVPATRLLSFPPPFPSLTARPCFFFRSALIKQVNKSIEGTADDDDEGVPTEQAIRAGLELLKVCMRPVQDGLRSWPQASGSRTSHFSYLSSTLTSASCPQVLSFTHPVSFHSAETFESLLGCLKMDDEKVAEAALQIFKNTGGRLEESFPHIKS